MDSKTIYTFLHEHFLFRYLTDDELGQILPLFKPITLEKGEVLYRTGFPGRNFFLIVTGQIMIMDEDQNSTVINANGHFGEKGLFKEGLRSETAQAMEKSILLAINKRGFLAILSAFPSIGSRISAMKLSDTILQKNEFPWIEKEETVRFVDRKHINVFYSQLTLPLVFIFITGIGAFLLHFKLGVFLPIIFLISSLWSIWLWLDWKNDYYLVTSERAAWIEKVIWLHDQRREVPLQSILSVNISTNQISGYSGMVMSLSELILAIYPCETQPIRKYCWICCLKHRNWQKPGHKELKPQISI